MKTRRQLKRRIKELEGQNYNNQIIMHHILLALPEELIDKDKEEQIKYVLENWVNIDKKKQIITFYGDTMTSEEISGIYRGIEEAYEFYKKDNKKQECGHKVVD